MIDYFSDQQTQMLFLVGVPRSGTTWLQQLLASHPLIGTAQESHLFNHFFAPMEQQWQQILNFQDGRGGIGLPAYFTEQEFYHSLAQYAYYAYSKCPEFSQHPIFLEKTPDHLNQVSLINRVIPSARFIYVRRNPADVIESLLAAGQSWGATWAPRNIFKAIRLLKQYKHQGEIQLQQLPSDRWTILDYEQLQLSPDTELRRLFKFLGVTLTSSQLNTMKTSPTQIHRYGEFAKRHGNEVVEPKGFRRKNKSTLTFWQKALVRYTF